MHMLLYYTYLSSADQFDIACTTRRQPSFECVSYHMHKHSASLPGSFHPFGIRPPVLQAIAAELLQNVQPLRGSDVNVALLLDFLKDPRLHESASASHHRHVGPLQGRQRQERWVEEGGVEGKGIALARLRLGTTSWVGSSTLSRQCAYRSPRPPGTHYRFI